ncbi:ABC transporter substrate-binding protein [Sporomusa aerivorans]|uniref:ABC transporter substrate-binding protein n=1 Tax=Sporomusa aerivorans TaxID=204936 RepID=UPI00352AF884
MELTNLTICQIISNYPETRDVFVHNGFPQFADDAVLQQLGPILKLKTALKSKNISLAAFVRLLEEKIEDTGLYHRLAAMSGLENSKRLNMVALLPCPLKIPLQTELNRFVEGLRQSREVRLEYCAEAFSTNMVNYDEYIKYFEDPDEVPDILITAGYSFFNPLFMSRFVHTGIFARIGYGNVDYRLEQAGLIDRESHFAVIAANVLVMVVDVNRLGDLPVPGNWKDLLQPIYEKQVVIRGHNGEFCDIVQLNFYKEYGEAGLAALAQAVRYGLHPAQMVKELKSSRRDVPSIHVMPYFFANTLTDQPNIRIIWPNDGALAFPVSVLVKTEKMELYKEMAEFLTGPHIARVCGEAFFPSVHPAGMAGFPDNARFKWLGWDFIREHDMEQLVEQVNALFVEKQQKEI